jgi:hypothetical protein
MNYKKLYEELKAAVIDNSSALGDESLCPQHFFDDEDVDVIECTADCTDCFKKAFEIFEKKTHNL